MQPIEINVHVKVGLADNLYGLLATLIKDVKAGAPAQPAPAVEKPATVAPPEVEAPAAEVVEPVAEAAPVDDAPAQDPEPEQPAQELTEVDVRAAMDRVRCRIEGEDWKENTSGEGYKKWHRRLNAWFKQQATFCGSEKPSTLPDHESRAAFIKTCDEVIVENDELVIKVPF